MDHNIRNPQGFENSWWNWAVYNDCFGRTGIRISDIDGVVERRGNFLWIETKRRNEAIPTGQRILFDHVVKNRAFEVLIIWGNTDQPEAWMSWRKNIKCDADVEVIKRVFRSWFAYANKYPKTKEGTMR